MKRPEVDTLVYKYLFPRPKQTDPHNFQDFLERYLVLEVRQEVHSFYGHLDTQEAKYPGLDYSHPTHRIRLSRWPWHRRLFRAFDSLGLTPSEIAQLTKWEGTKWAKERYEKEQNITIRDTAADGMPDCRASKNSPATRPREKGSFARSQSQQPALCGSSGPSERSQVAPRTAQQTPRPALARQSSQTPESSQPPTPGDSNLSATLRGGVSTTQQYAFIQNDITGDTDMADEDASDVDIDESIDLQLEQRSELEAEHNAGDIVQGVDEDWVQWLKTAIETGDVSSISRNIHGIAALPFLHSAASTRAQRTELPAGIQDFPAQILEAARQRNWAPVPDLLQSILIHANQPTEDSQGAADSVTVAPTTLETTPETRAQRRSRRAAATRRTYSTLRLPRQ